MLNYGAKGYVQGKLEVVDNDSYQLTTNKGVYKAKLTKDFAEYVELSGINLLDKERIFAVSPVTKDRGYGNRELGQVAYPPYLSFRITGVDPKKPVSLDVFTIVGSCIYQANPEYYPETNKLRYDPYVLLALSPHYIYRAARDNPNRRRPHTIKLIGELPSETGKPDAVKNTFEVKCTYDGYKLFILTDKEGNSIVRRISDNRNELKLG